MIAGRAERGFTLVELLVVVGVVALLAGLAAPTVGTVTGANVRKASAELAGGMRWLFDTGAMRHETCRLALDLDARAYWAECAPGAAAVARDPERTEDLARRFSGEKSEEVRRLLARSEFGAFEDVLLKKRELPGSAAFGEVHVEGRRGTSEGTVYVHFFPGGRAQRAHVPVVDGNHVYTIVLEPFTGRSRVVPGKVEVRE